MTIIVTGGAGFIGANYIFYHMAKYPEDKVVCVDKLTYAGNLSTLSSLLDESDVGYDADKAARFRFVKVDICDKNAVERLFDEERPDGTVIHSFIRPVATNRLTHTTALVIAVLSVMSSESDVPLPIVEPEQHSPAASDRS